MKIDVGLKRAAALLWSMTESEPESPQSIRMERDRLAIDIQKIRAGVPLSYSKTKCKHFGSWTTYDGLRCMACQNEALTSALTEAKAAIKEVVAWWDGDLEGGPREFRKRLVAVLERKP